jgi:hypothetical protein
MFLTIPFYYCFSMSHQYHMGKSILRCIVDDEKRSCKGSLVCVAKAYLKGIFGQVRKMKRFF